MKKYKDKDDDREYGKCIPAMHWQINKKLLPEGAPTAAGAFLPTSGEDRPTTHVKLNECDH